jgi:RND family efflux transporter MFP subunit
MAALGTALAACTEARTETAAETVRPVKVVEIGKADTARHIDYSGAVKARTEADLGFRVAGRIIERTVDIGDRVEPGQVLARLDATDYALAVTSAEASLVAAEKQVETAALTRHRAEQLLEKKVGPQSALDNATLGYQQAVATRDAAAASLQQAKNQVGYTELRADRGGVVTAIGADRGQVVAVGTPVVMVAVDAEKEVQIAVPETDIRAFETGMAVDVGFWTDDALKLHGRVREIAGSADPNSRTFSVRVSLPEDPRILLGMTATVSATVGSGQSFISVPLEALAEKDGRKIVWVTDRESSTVHARDVEVADFGPQGVRIVRGLEEKDLVVTAGTQFMQDNMKVRLPQDAGSARIADAEGAY